MDGLREKVFASLDNATENGYDMMEDANMIAVDLMLCDATYDEVSDEDAASIEGYVIEWQKGQRDGKS